MTEIMRHLWWIQRHLHWIRHRMEDKPKPVNTHLVLGSLAVVRQQLEQARTLLEQ